MRKKVLIISQSWLHKDPRVLVQYNTLKKDYEIETFALGAINDEVKNYKWVNSTLTIFNKIKKALLLFTRQYSAVQKKEILYSNIVSQIMEKQFDLIICNDLSAVPLGLTIANEQTPIWLDLHEYAPRQYEHDKRWRIFFQPYYTWQCKKLLPKMDTITTVCKGLAVEYEKEFEIKIDSLIYNAPNYTADINPSQVTKTIQLVHHGAATRHRKLELMVEMMKHVGAGYSLDFFLMSNNKESIQYENELKELSQNLPIRFNPPVPTNEIPGTLNKFDMGVFILEPVNFNYLNALPNKLFEFIQARLAVAVSPNPEMKRLTLDNNVGVVAAAYTPQALAEAIKLVNKQQLEFYKQHAHRVAKELSSQKSAMDITRIVTSLINRQKQV